jgi:hypothetical protein
MRAALEEKNPGTIAVPPAVVRLLKVAILASSLFVLTRNLHGRIDGEHFWRQTHVAANIERFCELGLSLRPTTYNRDAPVLVFDFPAYELLASTIALRFGTDPLWTARLVNVLLFVASFLVVENLLSSTGIGAISSLSCLLVFAMAPLDLHYFRAPIPDCLAIFLGLLSLAAFVRWEEKQGRLAFFVMVLSGALCTFVKNPVYLPIPIAIFWVAARRKGLLRSPALLSYFVAIGAAVVVFKLYSNHVNGIGSFLSPRESAEYFWTVHDRLRLKFWAPIFATVLTRGGGPLVLALGLLGGLFYALRAPGPSGSLYVGLGLGSLATLVIFFDKYNAHSYYCLPLVFPLAFFAGEALEALASFLKRRLGWAALVTVLVVFLGATTVSTIQGLRAMAEGSTAELAAAGDWIQVRTHPDDFVLYLLPNDEGGWLPAFLYFAKREGYNLPVEQFGGTRLASLIARLNLGSRRLVVFCPSDLMTPLPRKLSTLTLLDTSPNIGSLLLLEPDVALRAPKGSP